jgi:hypothetical protein
VGRAGITTLNELESRSGLDKRTISYYIQEMLLPKVGRRGRRTRCPEEFLDRLMFIRRVRGLQDAGQLRAVTLSETMPAPQARGSPCEARVLPRYGAVSRHEGRDRGRGLAGPQSLPVAPMGLA